MTHKDLCHIAEKWLKNLAPMRFPIVFSELVSYSLETPDVIGFNHQHTAIIEVKRSRSDFFADQKKWFRKYPENGLGDYRIYFCPTNVIKLFDLPENWGLSWINENNRIEVIKTASLFPTKNYKAERSIMYSALRRRYV